MRCRTSRPSKYALSKRCADCRRGRPCRWLFANRADLCALAGRFAGRGKRCGEVRGRALFHRSAGGALGLGVARHGLVQRRLERRFRVAEHAGFAVVPRYLVGYRATPGNMSSDALQMFRSTELVLDGMDDHLAVVVALDGVSLGGEPALELVAVGDVAVVGAVEVRLAPDHVRLRVHLVHRGARRCRAVRSEAGL